ncbi:hypothetical protein EDD21DRAFT_444720 [Dissophora ornata]|nr:hypothetical protein EDD21DRAFT_444720 [Dissophora ornata]
MLSAFGYSTLGHIAETVVLNAPSFDELSVMKAVRVRGTLGFHERISNHFSNTQSTTQKSLKLKPDKPDIIVKASEREMMYGEVAGPLQQSNKAKNAWDLY